MKTSRNNWLNGTHIAKIFFKVSCKFELDFRFYKTVFNKCTVRQFTKGREKTMLAAQETCFCCMQLKFDFWFYKSRYKFNWRLFFEQIQIPEPNVQCTVRQFTKGREETVSAAHEACFCRRFRMLQFCERRKELKAILFFSAWLIR